MRKTRPLPEPRPIPDNALRAVEGGSAAITAAVLVAGGAAYAANKQSQAAKAAAKAASAPSNQTTDMTTVRQSGNGNVQGELDYALAKARQQFDASAGGDGAGIQYTTRPDGRVVAVNPPKKGGGGGGAKAPDAGGTKAPSAAQQQRDIANQIVNTAKAGSPNLGAADQFVGDVLKPGSLGGNEVYQDLNERLKGSSLDKGNELLMQFMNGNAAGNYSGNGGAGGGGQPTKTGLVQGGGMSFAGNDARATAPGNMIPDSTTSPGLFNDWAKGMLDNHLLDPNDPALKDYLDVIDRQGREDLDAQLQDVGDEMEGVGMYGGSGLALERALTRSKGDQGVADSRTKALHDFRGQSLDAIGSAAGLVNQRDIAGGSLASSEREGAANRASSGSNAQAGIDAQLQIANRGMDLNAIQSYLQNNQFGVGQLGALGAGVSADRFSALDSMKDLEGVRYGGLNNAFDVTGKLKAQDDQAAAQAAARRKEAAAAPGKALDEYLNRLGFFAGQTDTTHQTGTGTNSNPAGAAPYLMNQGPGALSAGLSAGIGTYFQGQSAAGGTPTGRNNAVSAPLQPNGNR